MTRIRPRRRDVLTAGSAIMLSPAAGAAARRERSAPVIDVQGGIGNPFDDKARAALRRSGLAAVSMTVGEVGNGEDRYLSLLEDAGVWRGTVAANPASLSLVLGAGDIAAAAAAGRTGLILNVQDASWIGTDFGRIATARALGIRIVQLTYNVQNLVGSGAVEPGDGGLSIFGRRILAEIEARKLALDLSHGGRRTMAEAVAAAKRPPVISHTGCRAIADHPRNTDDATMRAVAAKGGFVGIYFMPYLAPGRIVTADDVVRHVEHAFRVCGEDHIAIGTDGDVAAQVADAAYRAEMKKVSEQRIREGIAAPGDGPDELLFVPELNGPDKFRLLADRLATRGWPRARIDKLLGANVARTLDAVWS